MRLNRARNSIGSFAFANLPSASSVTAGTQARVTDIGAAGSIWVSSGIRWLPENGEVVLINTGVPLVLPSSGSIGNNGALTGITGLPATYAHCYMYFPENAIAAGVAAGLYYVQMSSTSAGTIYNNTYTSGNPSIPASPTAFATTGPGAYTQTTGADITLISLTVPGNAMGIHGGLDSRLLFAHTNSANNKIHKIKLAGTSVYNSSFTTTTGNGVINQINNMGATNVQVASGTGNSSGLGSMSLAHATIDTTTDQSLAVTTQLANASDYAVLARLNTVLHSQ